MKCFTDVAPFPVIRAVVEFFDMPLLRRYIYPWGVQKEITHTHTESSNKKVLSIPDTRRLLPIIVRVVGVGALFAEWL